MTKSILGLPGLVCHPSVERMAVSVDNKNNMKEGEKWTEREENRDRVRVLANGFSIFNNKTQLKDRG